ncbi:MAG: hypothetical protein QW590_03770, partial [Candidatus Bilamarchaeaceae archaeon]
MDILKPNRSNFSIAGLFFLTATILLLALPATAMAQDPARNYGTAVQNPLQRTLDAYGKGPFCAGCHNIPYPLPPEGPVSPSTYPVEDTKAEAGLKRLISSRGRDVGAVYSPEGGRIVWVTESLGNWTIWIMNEDG